jgi:hypothetical protein
MITLNELSDQIITIIAEHKDCGGHCHCWNQPNDNPDHIKSNEHLGSILTYFVWGVIKNGIH